MHTYLPTQQQAVLVQVPKEYSAPCLLQNAVQPLSPPLTQGLNLKHF